jgi:hypothetical protein
MGRLTPHLVRAAAGGAAAVALLAGGCASQRTPIPRLLDGTRPPSLPARLDGLGGPTVVSRLTVTTVRRLGSIGRRCVDSFTPEFRVPADAIVIRRTGVVGESLTFANADRDVVLGCDRTARRPRPGEPWCGRSVGRVIAGRLRDLRLDVACHTTSGVQVGFGWIQSGAHTRWVTAGVDGVTEVSAVAAGLPVRVVTEDIDRADSSATFAIGEYGSAGMALRTYRFSAGVAG